MGGKLGRLVEREAPGELQACLCMPGPAPQPGSAELLPGTFPVALTPEAPLFRSDRRGLQRTLLPSCLDGRGGVGAGKVEE